MSEKSDCEEESCTPPEVADIAKTATLNLLPEKSRKQYQIAYNRFQEWCADKKVVNFTENALLAYFSDRASKIKPSSLWSEYSMVRASLSVDENLDIRKFAKLTAFLKRNSTGFRTKKSKIFSREQIYTFLKDAPDGQYLMKRVIAIFGIAGACRRDELQKMTTDKERSFVVKGEVEEGLNLLDIYHKYAKLRPAHTAHNLFFVHYNTGKCTVQPVGVNTFAKVPCEIPRYLGLEKPELYTGHSFRRSSATLLADTGADVLSLKRHGGWKSATVAEGYVEESLSNKISTAEKILQGEKAAVTTDSKNEMNDEEDEYTATDTTSLTTLPGIHIHHCSDTTVNVNIYNNV